MYPEILLPGCRVRVQRKFTFLYADTMNGRLDQLLEFLKEHPADPFLTYAVATEYLKLHDTAKALHYYEQLVKEHPDYVGTYYHLGKLYESLNRVSEALNTYEAGMRAARLAHDAHALRELQAARQWVLDQEEEEE